MRQRQPRSFAKYETGIIKGSVEEDGRASSTEVTDRGVNDVRGRIGSTRSHVRDTPREGGRYSIYNTTMPPVSSIGFYGSYSILVYRCPGHLAHWWLQVYPAVHRVIIVIAAVCASAHRCRP